MKKVFISYSRSDEKTVKELADDLILLGHSVWFDQHLEGGQDWWNKIIANILNTDFFIFILTLSSIKSLPCKKELQYAVDLKKIIIPIRISEEKISMNLLSPKLSKIQIVEYNKKNKNSILKIAKILFESTPSTEIPSKIPTPPEIPISNLGRIADKINFSDNMSYEMQSALFIDLKNSLTDSSLKSDVYQLLKSFRKRRDIFASVAEEIDNLLKKSESIIEEKSNIINIKGSTNNYKKKVALIIITFLTIITVLAGGHYIIQHEDIFYQLFINVIPKDANIEFINFEKKYHNGIQLQPGNYEVIVSKDGYHSEKIYVKIKDHDTSKEVHLNKKTYELYIKTIPDNSIIEIINHRDKYYDGIKLIPGNYEIVVNKYGYEKMKDVISINNENYYKTIKLEKKPYNLSKFKFPKLINYKILKNDEYIDNSQLRFETIGDSKFYQISLQNFDFIGYSRNKKISTYIKVNDYSFLSSIVSEGRKKIYEILVRRDSGYFNDKNYEFHDYSLRKNIRLINKIQTTYKFWDFISLFVFLSKNVSDNKQFYSKKINLFVLKKCYLATCNYSEIYPYKIKGSTIKTEKFVVTYKLEDDKRNATRNDALLVFYIHKNLKDYTFPVCFELIGNDESFKLEATDF